MSDEYVDDGSDDISQSLAAACTGTTGMPDDAAADGPLYESMASAIEAFDEHEALKGREPEVVEEDEQPREPGKVPLGALREERAKRQQLQLQLEAQAQELAQYQQQLAQYQQQVTQAQQQEAIPDFDEDPRGYIEAKERQFTEQLQSMQRAREYEQATVQFQQQAQQLSSEMTQVEAEFTATHPDYHEAVAHVLSSTNAHLRQQYPNAPDAEILAMQTLGAVQFMALAKQQGFNAAERLYQTALSRGYNPDGARVPSAGLPRPAPTSLSTLPAGGRAPDQQGKVRAADIANMPQEDFDKLWAAMKEGGTQRPAV
jgi:hypothetical protein